MNRDTYFVLLLILSLPGDRRVLWTWHRMMDKTVEIWRRDERD